MNKIAFVIGNGVSRAPIDLFKLKTHGVTYGCNALYREFSPDHLIAVDPQMIYEILDSGYHKNNQLWVSGRISKELPENVNRITPYYNWDSGNSALLMACASGVDEIYLIGFDYMGVGDGHSLINNMYAGTKNYKNKTDSAVNYINWLRHTKICVDRYPKINFTRVSNAKTTLVNSKVNFLKNVLNTTVEDFKHQFCT
jgi:hypothetical protein